MIVDSFKTTICVSLLSHSAPDETQTILEETRSRSQDNRNDNLPAMTMTLERTETDSTTITADDNNAENGLRLTSCQKKKDAQNNTRKVSSVNKRRRVVSFHVVADVQEVLHLKNYSAEERGLTWYNMQEITRIKAECAEIARRMGNGMYTGDTDLETSRGLEHRPRRHVQKYRQDKLQAFFVVMEEQDMGSLPKDIAQQYKFVTKTRREAAIERAIKDQKESRQINSLPALQTTTLVKQDHGSSCFETAMMDTCDSKKRPEQYKRHHDQKTKMKTPIWRLVKAALKRKAPNATAA